jgi:hypothetical protein
VANNSTNISQTVKGQIFDLHPMYFQDGMYGYAKNAMIEGFDGSGFPVVQNEPSNILAVSFPSGSTVVGNINVIEQNRIIWFLYNPLTGDSEIGETLNPSQCRKYVTDSTVACDDCTSPILSEKTPLEQTTQTACATYRTIQKDDCFNFSTSFPVNSVTYMIDSCSLKIFFTDDNNPRRWLEFNYENNDPTQGLVIQNKFFQIVGFENPPCDNPVYSTSLDCNAINVQPSAAIPCIEVEGVVGGGSLLAGSYQFFVTFADIDGNRLSSFFSVTNPVPIFTRFITDATNYPTDKSIQLAIENLDPLGAYQFYNLAVAKTIDSVTSFFSIGTFPITQTSYTYTGNIKGEIEISEADIFGIFPYYKTAGSVTSSNGILYYADLTQNVKPNLQRVANNILLNWQTIAIPEEVYRDPLNTNRFRGYMRDEVYPFGIVFVYDTGEESNAYHIPGRVANEGDLAIVNNNDSIQENSCVDCSSSGSTETQITITPRVVPDCSTSGSTIVLNDNSCQASGCTLVPFTSSPCSTTGINPPAVNAGPNQTITYVGIVSLNGIVNPTGGMTIVSTNWAQLSGPNQVIIANPGLLNTTFQDINSGTYVFQLCALASDGSVGQASVTYNVNVPVNVPPISNPGEDQIIILPTNTGALNGSASSDPDGSISAYQWTQVSGPNTATIVSPNASYTNISGLILGDYVFNLEVTDNRACSSNCTTIVHVINDPCDDPPSCTSLLYPVNGSITTSFSVVTLQWNSVDCATSYDVFYKRDIDVSYTLAGNTASTFFNLLNLDPNTIYDWYVVPKSAAGSATGCDSCFFQFVTPVQGSGTSCNRERWQVYNTATILGGDLEIYDGCTETCYQFGSMSYWQSTETYPSESDTNSLIWGDLCGQPIRHHKFPDSLVTHIHDNQNGTPNYFQSNIVYVMGVKVDHDSVVASIAAAVSGGLITQADANRIVAYRIVRGNRFDNKSVVGKGLIFDVNNYQRKNGGTNFDQQLIYFSNYPFNDLRSNPFITDNFQNYDTHNHPVGPDLPFTFCNRYTFHSPDTHFSEPTAGTILKLETVEYGQAEGYYNISQKQSKQRFLSDTSYAIAFTSGIIAALLNTQEKVIKDYTVKGSVVSALGLASGEWGPYLPYQTGTGAAIVPESVLDTALNIPSSASINAATEVTTRTVQGKYSDFVDPLYLAEYKPELLPIYPFILAQFLSSFLTTALQETNIVLSLIESLTPYRDWSVQYQGVGKYNAFTTVANDTGNKIRRLDSFSYLGPDNTFINEVSQSDPTQNISIKYNNWDRESSLYLRYQGVPFPDAGTSSGIVDMSRETLGSSVFNCTLNQNKYSPISSYYASMKNYVPDQYGTIFNIDYLPTDSCTFQIGTSNSLCRGVYGGDTFITRFALKIKVPYFLATTFNLPDGTDFAYDLYTNLAVPRNYYDNTAGVGTGFDSISDILSIFSPTGLATLLGRPKSIRDCSTSKFFYQNGYIYLYHYGIPYFLVESDYNTDYRYGTNNEEGDFYPNQQDLNFWLQEMNVPIAEDNTYFYNKSYSKQNEETTFAIDPPDFIPGRECDVNFPNRIIYSNGGNWLQYPANNFFDYPLSYGRIVSIDGIENQTVLVRTDNAFSIFKSILRLPVDGQTVQVGNGSVFANPPQDFAVTNLGYVGTQNKAILNTEFGHIWSDAKRGQIFNVGSGAGSLDEISKDGMKNWFKENLPFRLLRDFPNMPETVIDNSFAGMGICMSFDKRFNRFLITKRDWKKTNPNVQYDSSTNEFFIIIDSERVVINVGDPKYFKDCSWTASYNFYTKTWVAFHSYKPNYYLDFIDFFGSGINSGFWAHNLYNGSFQVYYGKLYPFIVEPVVKFDQSLRQLNSIEFDTEVRRYYNEFDYTIKRNIPGFNKAIVYNDLYNSGLLNLTLVDKNNFTLVGKYPMRNPHNWEIEVSPANYKWRFNQFFALNKDFGEVPMWHYLGNNEEKVLNNQAFNYQKSDYSLARLKGQWFRERLINDKLSNYKILFKLSLDNQTTQFR